MCTATYAIGRVALCAAIATALCHLSTGPAAAEEAALGLEEVMVTARKREEPLQRTPVSVTALSAADFAAYQLHTIADVGRFSPNVSLDSGAALSGGSNTVTVFIRGIGQTDFNLTIDPGVGIYVDGVYVSRSVGALLDTADVEQVQILRGPQGTLFGKNTIGGAVLVTTRRPSERLEFSADLATGEFDRFDVQAAASVPLSDRLRTLTSLSMLKRDGHVERLSDGDTMGDRDQLTGRFTAEFDVSDDASLSLSIDGLRARESAPGLKLLALDESGLFPVTHNIFQNGASCAPPMPDRQTNPLCYTTQWLTDSSYTTYASDRNSSDTDIWGATLTATWQTGWSQLKSITAYRDLESEFFLEADGSPLSIANTGNDYSQDQFSQELQIAGKAAGERLDWLLGLYYLKERGEDVNSLQWSIGSGVSGGSVDNDSTAAFANLTWRVTDAMSVTAGLRYTDETKRFTPDQYLLALDPTVSAILFSLGLTDLQGGPLSGGDLLLPPAEAEISASELTPALTLDYRFTDDVFGYATYSRGFKSGGFTQRVFPPLPEAPSFEPEFVDNYEIGLKTELLDRRLRLNAAVFYTDYTDLQITVTRFVAPTIENAGRARSRGAELEFEARFSDRVRLAGGVGYTDAEYTDVPQNAAPVTRRSQLPNAPEWTANARTTIDLVRSAPGALRLLADWSYRDEHYKDAANSPTLRQGGYGLLGASLEWTSVDQRWSISAGATNLTDEEYLVTGNADLSGGGYAYGVVGRPREWFVTLGYAIQ